MQVLVTAEPWPEGSAGHAAARDVADAVRAAWLDATPGVAVTAIATSDGGPRLADVLSGGVSKVGGAVARDTAAGLVLAPTDGATRWNPQALSAALLGIAADASSAGHPVPVIVPLGDVGPAGDAVDVWGGGLAAFRVALSSLTVTALTGSSRPLLGLHGMSAATMAGRETDIAVATAAQEQENRWARIAREADAIVGQTSLVGPSRLSHAPGAGAAGGLAYCLAAAGARLTPAAHYAADLVGARRAAEGATLVAAVCGPLTPALVDHGTASAAALIAADAGVPAIAITTDLAVGKRDLMAAGLSGAFAAAGGLDALAEQVARVAHTWTRGGATPEA